MPLSFLLLHATTPARSKQRQSGSQNSHNGALDAPDPDGYKVGDSGSISGNKNKRYSLWSSSFFRSLSVATMCNFLFGGVFLLVLLQLNGSIRGSIVQNRSLVHSANDGIVPSSISSLRRSEHHENNEVIFQNISQPSISYIDFIKLWLLESGTVDGTDSAVHQEQCRWYLAESAIPMGGLGMFTAHGLHKDEMVGIPDICIFVSDPPDQWTHLSSHTFGQGTFFGQYEGKNFSNRAACEGFTTTYNTVPIAMVNTAIVSPVVPTNAGLHRAVSPGAGSITHHFGIHGKAKNIIRAGSELTVDYGDWNFDDDKLYVIPERPVPWLQRHGWCIDNIEIKRSLIPHAGRGAFARYKLKAGDVIAPAPLQVFKNRELFRSPAGGEQLFINYCLQPTDSDMLLFPYGVGVNLINHDHHNPNVYWRWSDNSKNTMHHGSWLDLSYDDFWNVISPGRLILEVVATRDIEPGEELVIDYGLSWENAWNDHVAIWEPPFGADKYVYPADIDETEVLRTVKEQENDPYPKNLITMCSTPEWNRAESGENHITWYESTEYEWYELMAYCHILDREVDDVDTGSGTGDYVYTVSLELDWGADSEQIIASTMERPKRERYIDYKVPRRAIRFVERPYNDDEHISTAFRHPITLPSVLTPETWKNTKRK